jgi:hypothetical protein
MAVRVWNGVAVVKSRLGGAATLGFRSAERATERIVETRIVTQRWPTEEPAMEPKL